MGRKGEVMPIYSYRCKDLRCGYEFETFFARTNPTDKLDAVACPKCRRQLADKLNPQPEEDEDADI
jgi:putative FmdB family regulatory protein